jgi:hypothetical protein
MGDNGFIKVHRKMKDSKVWYYTASQFKVWMTILMECNWKEGWGRFQGEEVKVKPGQLLTSRKHLADCSGLGKNTVRKTLTKLEKDDMINCERTNQGTRITVLNWSKYQENEDGGTSEGDSGVGNEPDSKGDSEGDTHEEVNNGNKGNKNTTPESEDSERFDKDSLKNQYGERPVEFVERMVKGIKRVNDKASTPNPKTKTYKNWVVAFDRLNRIGPEGGDSGYSWDRLEEILTYAFQDQFWSKNVASPIQLRKKGNNGLSKIVNIENSMESDKTEENSNTEDVV